MTTTLLNSESTVSLLVELPENLHEQLILFLDRTPTISQDDAIATALTWMLNEFSQEAANG